MKNHLAKGVTFLATPFIEPRRKKALQPSNLRHVVLYKSLDLAFNRVKKSANSSTLMFIADTIRAVNEGQANRSAKTFKEYRESKQKAIEAGRVMNLFHLFLPGTMRMRFVTVVRDPYSRLLSAYLQKRYNHRKGYSEIYEKFPGFTDDDDKKGFSRFCEYIEKSGPYGNKHWWPQVRLLIMPPEFFDFVLKVETLDHDLNDLFSKIVPNWKHTNFAIPHPNESGEKITNASQRVEDFYTPSLKAIVRDAYRDDFEAFSY